nr:DNA polymerase [Okeania sp. SIO3I5]
MSANSPTALLIDGHSLAFRSYYAFAKSRSGGLKTSTGIPTSVCFGFLKSLLEVIETQKPEYLAIAFDLGEPTFRHKADENYKADRPEAPEDLITDLENLKELLRAFNLTVITAPGYEADDILGTLAKRGSAVGFRVKVLSGDQDLFQLIDVEKGISVLHLAAGKGSTPKEFFAEEVKEKLGILPSQVVDYKALCGDKSDNIPGVRGIGEKTAVKLLNEYGCLAEIYGSLDKIKGANQKKLVAGKAEAEHSQFMAKIEVNVPLNIDIEDCQVKRFSRSEIEPVLQRLELQNFLNQIPDLEQQFNGLLGIKSLPDESESQQQEKLTNTFVEVESDDWFFSAEDTKVAQQEIATKSEIEPQIIDTPEKLKELVNILKEQKNSQSPVAWDTETTSLEPRDAKLVGIGCCWGKNIEDVAYIPTGHKIGKNLDKVTVLEALKPILESADYPKVFQNTKFDRSVFRCQGIRLAGVVFDTMLASYVLNPGAKHSLEEIYIRYLTNKGINLQSYNDVVSKNQTIADLDILKVADYCGTQVCVTFQLVEKLRAELEKADKNQPAEKSLYKLLVDVEQPLEVVLAEMKFQGIRLDLESLKKLSSQLQKDAQKNQQIDLESLKKLSVQLQKDAPKNQPTEKSLYKLLVDVEQPLESVLAEMEFQGINIDLESLKKLSVQLQKDAQKNQPTEKSLYRLLVDVKEPLEVVLAEMEFQGIKIELESLKKLSRQLQKDAPKNQSSEKSLYRLLMDVEQPLESVLAEMEFQGIKIDLESLKKLSSQLQKDAQKNQQIDLESLKNLSVQLQKDADKNQPTEKSLYKLLVDVEQPLESVLAEMESQEIRLDLESLKKLSSQLQKDAQKNQQIDLESLKKLSSQLQKDAQKNQQIDLESLKKLSVQLQKDAPKNQPTEKYLYRLLMDVEQSLESVLAEMEFQGIKIDLESLKKLSSQLQKDAPKNQQIDLESLKNLSSQLQKDAPKNQPTEKYLYRLLMDVEQSLESVLAEMEFQGIKIDLESLKKLSSQLQKDAPKNQQIDLESLKNLSSQLQKDAPKNQPAEKSLYKLLVDVEQPLESVLAEMESQEIRLDLESLKKLSSQLQKDAQKNQQIDLKSLKNLSVQLQKDARKNQPTEKSLYKLLVDVEQPLESVLAEMESQEIRLDLESLKNLSVQLQKDARKNQPTEKSLYRLLVDVKEPLEVVLAEMEFQGIRLDLESLKKLSSQLQKDAQKNQPTEKSLYRLLVDVKEPLEVVLAEMEFQGIRLDLESLKKLSVQLQKDAPKNQLTEKSLYKLLVDVEQPLESVLAEMEFQGIRIDIEYLKKFSIQLQQDLEKIEKRASQTVDSQILQEHLKTEIHKIDPNLFTNQQELKKAISSPILKAYVTKLSKEQRQDLATLEKQINQAETSDLLNLNSPSQLSELLFEILHQNQKKSRRIKTGYSTDVVVLEKLQTEPQHHPIIDEILNHRTLYKLFSTYVEAIPKLVRSDTQRVHTNFNQTQTDTGRLSSSEPNLQNIPIGTEFSRQIRQAFLPKKDWLLVAADYSQIELRILAHLSQEPVLIEAYQNNQDVHTVTAKLLFEKAEISPEERRVGKTINFGVIYGMGAQKLARSVKITVKESKQFLERYKQQYSQVFAYLNNLKKQAIAQGYVETILGRRRYFEFESKTLRDLKGKPPEEINLHELKLSQNDAQILRAAANSPIQGSSADIIKIAMIRLNEILTNYQTKLLLQVHDELVFEVPLLESEELPKVIKSTMENSVNLKVPLIVDIHGGKNWMEAK